MEYKGYMIELMGSFPMFKVKAKGQGRVPDKLTGTYTSRTEAIKSVDLYLSSLMKGNRNGKTKGTSTG